MPVIGTAAPVSARRRAPATRSVRKNVIVVRQRARIGARNGRACELPVLLAIAHALDIADREEIAAHVAVEIHAGVVLLVHHIGQRDAELADGVARAGRASRVRKLSRPPKVPPAIEPVISIVPTLDCTARRLRVGSYGSLVATTLAGSLPTTSGWPLPIEHVHAGCRRS